MIGHMGWCGATFKLAVTKRGEERTPQIAPQIADEPRKTHPFALISLHFKVSLQTSLIIAAVIFIQKKNKNTITQ